MPRLRFSYPGAQFRISGLDAEQPTYLPLPAQPCPLRDHTADGSPQYARSKDSSVSIVTRVWGGRCDIPLPVRARGLPFVITVRDLTLTTQLHLLLWSSTGTAIFLLPMHTIMTSSWTCLSLPVTHKYLRKNNYLHFKSC